MTFLHNEFLEKKQADLAKTLDVKNPMQLPKILKVVVNMGVGDDAVRDSKIIEHARKDLELIAGQAPVITRAKKSIAGFKLREGMKLGCKVTLRKKQMHSFLDRLIYVALPRVRDFRGLSGKSFDGRGNYSLGIKEQLIFPEIDYDKVDKIRGMDITIVTSAEDDASAKALLECYRFPFMN